MMGNVNGIIADGIKAFGTGGRLYSDADPSEPAPAPASATSPAAPPPAKAPERKRRWRGLSKNSGSTVLELGGITALAVGAYQIAPPAGWITVGISLIVLGVATGVEE